MFFSLFESVHLLNIIIYIDVCVCGLDADMCLVGLELLFCVYCTFVAYAILQKFTQTAAL